MKEECGGAGKVDRYCLFLEAAHPDMTVAATALVWLSAWTFRRSSLSAEADAIAAFATVPPNKRRPPLGEDGLSRPKRNDRG